MSRRRTTRPHLPRADGGALVVYGVNAVRELLRTGGPVARVVLARGPGEGEIAALAASRGVPSERAERGVLDQLARSPSHQGVVAVAPPFRYCPLEDMLDPGRPSVLLLDGVQDPRNLGAILRTARSAGVGGVILPRDRNVGITSVVAAASAGHVFGLPIAQVTNLVRAMEALKRAGYWLVGLAPRGGTSLYDLCPPGRPALVVGGEGEGLRALVTRHCDFTVSIPMASGVESLNVSVAVAVALYDLTVRRATA